MAAEYNIAPDEAQRRLQQVEQQATQAAQEAERRAREAADAAATAGAVAAYWVFAAMLLGAVAAVLGARIGTRSALVGRATPEAKAGEGKAIPSPTPPFLFVGWHLPRGECQTRKNR